MHNVDSKLKLSYSPLTLYEFDNSKADEDIYNYLASTSIYVIAKRALPIMKLIHSASNGLTLSIRMDGNPSTLELIICEIDNPSLFGPVGLSAVRTGSNILNCPDVFQSITLFRHENGEDKFVLNANVDRLIHLASNNAIKLRIKGDITPFVSYEVLYVGQCVGEHIFQRFRAHHALIDILVEENIIPKDYDKVNDLVILPFTIESDVISLITGDAKQDEFVEAMTGAFQFGHKEISLDCEKALIRAMAPKYNKTRFKQYPKSSDGLFNHKLDSYVYRIFENIVLYYGPGNNIYGDVNGIESSAITIVNDNEFYIFNH